MEGLTLDQKLETLQEAVIQLQEIVSKLLDVNAAKAAATPEEVTPEAEPLNLPPVLSREYVQEYSGELGEDISEPVFNNAVKVWSENWKGEEAHLSFEWIRNNCL